jgi:hypothetical protein
VGGAVPGSPAWEEPQAGQAAAAPATRESEPGQVIPDWEGLTPATPPQVDPAAIPAHSPMVQTVRYRNRQLAGPDAPPATEAPAQPGTIPEAPGAGHPTGGEEGGDWTASGTGVETAALGPGEDAGREDQWHHKASSALGFHRSKHHLTKRETAGVVVLVVLLLVGIAVAVLALTGNLPGGRQAAPPSPTPTVQLPPAQPEPGSPGATKWSLEQNFRAGDFVLVLDSYEDGLAELADPGSEVAENGQWVLVGITVKNAGTEDGTFLPEQQFLITDKGKEYPNEPLSALKHAEFILGVNAIKPGGSQTGFLAFDIPLEDRPVALRFIGRIGEPPITVPLG